MKRRHVIAGGVAVLSVGTFVAINQHDNSKDFSDVGADDEETVSPTNGTSDGGINVTSSSTTSGTPQESSEDGPAGTVLSDADELNIPVEIERGPDARNVTNLVVDALAYWEDNAKIYAGVDVEYEPVDEDAYLTVELNETVESCGIHSDNLSGCADLPGEQLPGELTATVETSMTDQAVYETAIHELGHTLNLGHEDSPRYFMRETQPEPWERDTADVYVDSAGPGSSIVAGLDWLGDNTQRVRADFEGASTRNAGIVVESAQNACDGSFVACPESSERYSDQLIVRVDEELEPAVYDWYVAKTVADLAGENPEILSNDTPSDVRRSDWWNNAET